MDVVVRPMMNCRTTPPVVVVGMHRSGTSMLSRLLENLGVFMGRDLTGNAESLFFQSLNRYIIEEAGGDWVNVKPVFEHLQSQDFVQRHADRLINILIEKRGLRRFHGEFRFFTWSLGFSTPWGWKDPRNTVTLPIWLAVFSRLRVIHIVRSGIDVAISLHRRENCRSRDDRDFRLECLDFDACFNLWDLYSTVWQRHRGLVPDERRLEIQYESVLQDPETTVRDIACFMGLDVTQVRVAGIAEMVNRNHLRKAAFREKYAEMIARLPPSVQMKELGYDETD